MSRKYGYGQNDKLAGWFVETMRAAQNKPVCEKCNGTGYLPQPAELDRWYSPQRCSCHPAYVAATERLRSYS